jgi:hypothetical protein
MDAPFVELQNLRTSEPQNFRTSELQNLRTSESQNFRTSELQNLSMLNLRVTKVYYFKKLFIQNY